MVWLGVGREGGARSDDDDDDDDDGTEPDSRWSGVDVRSQRVRHGGDTCYCKQFTYWLRAAFSKAERGCGGTGATGAPEQKWLLLKCWWHASALRQQPAAARGARSRRGASRAVSPTEQSSALRRESAKKERAPWRSSR